MLYLSLSLCLQTNYRYLRYRRQRHDIFGDTLLAGTKSKRGNKYTKVFFTKFGGSRAFPITNKGGVHEALSLLFHQDEVPPKIIVDG